MDEDEFEDEDNIDDQDIDDILEEDDDEDIVEEETTIKKSKKKIKAKKPKAKADAKSMAPTKQAEDYKWQKFNQPAFEGWQNSETGEIIDGDEMIRRVLCYAEEAALNTR